MKLLVVQFSDLHCPDSADTKTLKIPRAIDAILACEKFDKAVVVFSGDLADSAAPNQYKAARSVTGAFITALRSKAKTPFIPFFLVPGNHDLYLPDGSRDIKVIEKWKLVDHLPDELDRLKNFFQYSSSQKCFLEDKLIDTKKVLIDGKIVQIVLLNSAPFSTREKEDKQVHFLPQRVLDIINEDVSADLRIAVMHHSYEWCEWDTKVALKNAFAQFDLVMFGHDHVSERVSITSRTGGTLEILKGGKLSLLISEESSFNTIIYDTDTSSYACYAYEWNTVEKIFVPRKLDSQTIQRQELAPTSEYLNCILEDKQKLSDKISDYYVFPKLFQKDSTFATEAKFLTDEASFFAALEERRVIGITGSYNCGKSTLLKHLYAESIKHGYLPLYIEKRNYDSNIEKMLRDLFEEQYGEIALGFEHFIQSSDKKRIFFIDDFDLVKSQKVKVNLISYVLDHRGVLIFSTKEWTQNDLTDVVKEKIQERGSCVYEVLPFYKEKRDELAYNIFNIYGKTRIGSPDQIISALDYLAQCQASLFSLNPEYLVQYIRYFIKTESVAGKGRETLTVIFETNIRTSIINNTKSDDVGIYLSALEYIAYDMYFNKRVEAVSLSDLQALINDFNKKRRCRIQIKPFIETCVKSGVFSEGREDYVFSFSSQNIYAYFVAKQINASLERNPGNLTDARFVLSHICFGINDTIVLFLSTLRNNSTIVLAIADKAEELLSDFPELDLDSNNLPFLKYWQPASQKIPSKTDVKQAAKNAEAIEKQRQESVKYRGIFDYSEDDVEKDRFKIQRAFRYLQIICRALVDQYGNLEAEDISRIVSSIYHLTPKIIYATLRPYQDDYENIIDELRRFSNEVQPESNLTDHDLKKLLSQAAVDFTLNVMNDIAYNAATGNTIQVLDEMDIYNSNFLLQNLMMHDNAGDSSSFVSKAVEAQRSMNGNSFTRSLISRIAGKHVIYTPSISHTQIDKLVSGGVLSANTKKAVLLEQRYREQKKK